MNVGRHYSEFDRGGRRGHTLPRERLAGAAVINGKLAEGRGINIAYQEHDWLLISLKTNFRLDPIRSDPRFAELVRKVGLPQ